jgi:thymidylate kinase
MTPSRDIQEVCLNVLRGTLSRSSPLSPAEAGQAVEFCRRNKISMLDLSRRDWGRYLASDPARRVVDKAAAAESSKYQGWRDSFVRIQAEWRRCGIESLFHKSSGQFPAMSDNLDVLVRETDFSRAEEVLVQLGYAELRNVQEAHKKLFRKFEGEAEWAPIHLHERVCWGVPFEDNEHLWAHSRVSAEDGHVRFPCPEDVIIVQIAHSFLEDHLIRIAEVWTLKKCLQDGIDWPYIIRTAEAMHWAHALWTGILIYESLHLRLFGEPLFPATILERAEAFAGGKRWIRSALRRMFSSGPVIMPFAVPHLWTRYHTSLRVITDRSFGSPWKRGSLVIWYLVDGLIHQKLGFNPHPRMFIAFCGADGSGKTRHSEALRQAFRTSGIKARTVWSRAGSLPLTQRLLRIMRKAGFSRPPRDQRRRDVKDRQRLESSLKMSLWMLINGLDLVFFTFFTITLPLIFGGVVIADRFLVDFLVDLESTRGASDFKRPFYRLLKLLLPSPDLVFYLNVHPDAIQQRRCDENPADLQKSYALYQNVLPESGVIVIDNSEPFEQAGGQVIHRSLTAFFRKYPDKYDRYRLVSLWY